MRALVALLVVSSYVGAAPAPARDAHPSLSDIAEAIGPGGSRAAFEGIAARAAGVGPRGEFSTEVVSLGAGRARFRQVRSAGTTELLLADRASWARDGATGDWAGGGPGIEGFVRGHEVHRMLLDLERRFRATGELDAEGCLPVVADDELAGRVCPGGAEAAGAPVERIELGVAEPLGGGRVELRLTDWRSVQGVRLPFGVEFHQAGVRHVYQYQDVLPFRLAPGVPLPVEPGALFARLGDLAELAAAHARTIEAHRRSDIGMLAADEGERSIVSSRSELRASGREAVRERLGGYFAATRFARYEDVEVPVVAVSADGTLGWLACEIEAEGTQTGADGAASPIAYGFSWVELYARSEGRWLRVGNASSPRP